MLKIIPGICCVAMCLYAHPASAQHSEKEIAAKLKTYSNAIYSCRDSMPDVLIRRNSRLMGYLANICRLDPKTLHMSFSGAGKEVTIVNADNGRMRAYYWDTYIDKTAFDVLVQFQAGDSTGVWKWNDAGSKKEDVSLGIYTPTNITSVSTGAGSIVYLIVSQVRIGQSSFSQQIEAYAIDGDRLKEAPFFKTKKGTKTSISIEYDPTFQNNYDVNASIHLSKDKQKLYIPLIANGVLKKSYLVYVFNGDSYVFDKNVR